MRCNNRVEQAHEPTRIRERRMGRFRCPASTQRFLAAFTRVCNLFRPCRHLLSASTYRFVLQRSFATWREATRSVAA
jgi:putative transposase